MIFLTNIIKIANIVSLLHFFNIFSIINPSGIFSGIWNKIVYELHLALQVFTQITIPCGWSASSYHRVTQRLKLLSS